jgi:hypothetical protein
MDRSDSGMGWTMDEASLGFESSWDIDKSECTLVLHISIESTYALCTLSHLLVKLTSWLQRSYLKG